LNHRKNCTARKKSDTVTREERVEGPKISIKKIHERGRAEKGSIDCPGEDKM